jgi:PAS domain-containing protein
MWRRKPIGARRMPWRDGSNQLVRWYCLLTDIHDRKVAEEALRQSEAFLAQAQRLTLTGSLWWNLSTGEITWSDECGGEAASSRRCKVHSWWRRARFSRTTSWWPR